MCNSVSYDLATRGKCQTLLYHLTHHSHTSHRLLLSALSALSLAKLRRYPDAAALIASLHLDPAWPPPPPPRAAPALPARPSPRGSPPAAPAPTRGTPSGAADHLAHREFDVALALLAGVASGSGKFNN
ncbi:hypothetical protein GUJ93_ZPchr0002g25160 [Zizania palustris]|uniref:Uncharacterized protein n=1 Tax=Zizania palustris TaxID=103762 RepID=A0A8J5RXV1_ZIZPA|nr:hypothetical protein GUJ93_ZPchr0002g25160 [Zizania palustris]